MGTADNIAGAGQALERRIDAYMVCGGKYHDFDFARLELLKLLAVDDHVRVRVAQHFGDVGAITASDFLVTYTCDLRPSPDEQQAVRSWVERGGRWVALHGTNCVLGSRRRTRWRPVHRARVLPGVGRHAREPVRVAPADRAVRRAAVTGRR